MQWSIVFVALTLAPGVATAQPAPATHVGAFLRMRQGEAAMQRGAVDDAVRLLGQAADEGAPPTVFRALAMALEAQSRWRDAAGAWTRYAALADRPEDRAEAIARREALRQRLTAVRVRVFPAAAARVARVWFDRDAPRWYQAGGLEAVSNGGEHRVRVEAAGYVVWERRMTTAFGDPVEIVVSLTPATTDGGSPGGSLDGG